MKKFRDLLDAIKSGERSGRIEALLASKNYRWFPGARPPTVRPSPFRGCLIGLDAEFPLRLPDIFRSLFELADAVLQRYVLHEVPLILTNYETVVNYCLLPVGYGNWVMCGMAFWEGHQRGGGQPMLRSVNEPVQDVVIATLTEIGLCPTPNSILRTFALSEGRLVAHKFLTRRATPSG